MSFCSVVREARTLKGSHDLPRICFTFTGYTIYIVLGGNLAGLWTEFGQASMDGLTLHSQAAYRGPHQN
jgi:hypothetical protein